jgi:sugar lactone lactonase YvrE
MTKAMLLAEGLYFGEGPRWRNDRLWSSDFYDHAVKSLDASGTVRAELEIDDQPRFACMLGGSDRRTLFTMTAPSSSADAALAARGGHVLCIKVETPGAGRP